VLLVNVMNTPELITYTLPAHWACVLINADYTGLTDEEAKQFDDFTYDEFGERGFDNVVLADDNEEPNFVTYHDVRPYGVLACDCLNYTFIR